MFPRGEILVVAVLSRDHCSSLAETAAVSQEYHKNRGTTLSYGGPEGTSHIANTFANICDVANIFANIFANICDVTNIFANICDVENIFANICDVANIFTNIFANICDV